MKKTFGLLGEKLGHSFSPLIHGYLGEYDYLLYEVSAGDLDSFMKNNRFDGINITIPYKQQVMPYCATLSHEAQIIGSVNTIIKDDSGALHGHNTDYHGFNVMLEQGGIDPKGKKTLVLGDGGSARTVRAALDGLGAREIVTISRRGENNYGNIERHYDADVIINTTPVGMFPDNGSSPLRLTGFRQLTGVADLIYNPTRTKLLLEAAGLGIPCVNGLAMLVAQAEKASRLFLDVPARPELVNKIHKLILKRTQNIALIGMPGCGKSTVGRLLAQKTGRPFIDIDGQIEAAAGKSIPQIFSEDGEETFRQLETRVLAEEAKKSGTVLATGGGGVTRPENFDLLRQNSLIVYLKRELTELITDGRPLSQNVGIQALANKRLPLYEAWSDFAVQVEAKPEQTAARIEEVIQ
ncbi:MAG: AAA family ATPase [Treponema sp.]|nr:AAA family ATPase [Treponema sp.]